MTTRMTAREERLPEKAVKMLFSSRLQRYARGARVHSKLAANSEHLHARLKRDKQRVQKDVTTVSEHNVRLIDVSFVKFLTPPFSSGRSCEGT